MSNLFCLGLPEASARLITGTSFSLHDEHLLNLAVFLSFSVKKSTTKTCLFCSYHTLNVDLTSPTFTDLNLRYAAQRDGVSASLSAPAAGFMGLQFNTRIPYQMRVYGRYPVSTTINVYCHSNRLMKIVEFLMNVWFFSTVCSRR